METHGSNPVFNLNTSNTRILVRITVIPSTLHLAGRYNLVQNAGGAWCSAVVLDAFNHPSLTIRRTDP